MRSRRTEATVATCLDQKPSSMAIRSTRRRGKTQCWDCGEFGHWGGDAQCTKPGAGLFKPKGAGRKNAIAGAKQVKVVETLNTEHVIGDGELDTHEVMVVDNGSLPFKDA